MLHILNIHYVFTGNTDYFYDYDLWLHEQCLLLLTAKRYSLLRDSRIPMPVRKRIWARVTVSASMPYVWRMRTCEWANECVTQPKEQKRWCQSPRMALTCSTRRSPQLQSTRSHSVRGYIAKGWNVTIELRYLKLSLSHYNYIISLKTKIFPWWEIIHFYSPNTKLMSN